MKQMKGVYAILFVFVLLLGCSTQQQNPNPTDEIPKPETIGKIVAESALPGDRVYVEYEGQFEDGSVFDASKPGKPLIFVLGSGNLLQKFESAVIGMKVGDEKTITLKPTEAYGEYDPTKVEVLPYSLVYAQGNLDLNVGKSITVGGDNPRIGNVLDANAEWVKVDFNHRLAGKTLIFNIKLADLKLRRQNIREIIG